MTIIHRGVVVPPPGPPSGNELVRHATQSDWMPLSEKPVPVAGGGRCAMILFEAWRAAYAVGMSVPFTAILAQEDVMTGDGRFFLPGAFTWREPPLPLNWLKEDSHGGPSGASFTVGRIDSIERVGNDIVGRGFILTDAGAEAAQALALIEGGALRGVSIDFEPMAFEVRDFVPEMTEGGVSVRLEQPVEVHEKDRIMGATIVAFPAFPGAGLSLDPTDDIEEVEAAAARTKDVLRMLIQKQNAAPMPFGSDEEAPEDESPDEESSDTPFDVVWDVVMGTEAEGAFMEIVGMTGAEWSPEGDATDEMDSLIAGAAPKLPALAWFANPNFTGPQQLTVEKSGRVYGHVALWDACHIALPGCQKPPRSASGYAYFLRGRTETAEGDFVSTGPLTVGPAHAGLKLSAAEAAVHYEDTHSAVADVMVGEDEHGIWVAGAVRFGATADQVHRLRASAQSGDWRQIKGGYELVGIMAVNVPGFPVARIEGDRTTAFVASACTEGMVTKVVRHPSFALARKALARSIGEDPASRLAQIRKLVDG